MADKFPYYFDEQFDEETNHKVNLEIMKYAGMYILKRLDLPAEEGGHAFEVPLAGLDEHLEPILDDLMFHNLIEIDENAVRYALSDEGRGYVDKLIVEIEGYIDKYQEFEPTTRVNLMKRDRINPLRARFLWGLYDGEFDDFELWQENWEVPATEKLSDWRDVITKKEFYDMLFEDINHMDALDDDALDQVLREAEEDRQKNMPQVQINRVDGDSGDRRRRDDDDGDQVVVREYHDPYYFNPVYDPLFWYVVF
ncbi:MAG: hypothetical protein OEZ36_08360 [Spirochaetota bacterium]|nr:hypothetical protein [Spirochaetota bacterium]